MRIFISAGEPSGDLHGANLALALKQADPNVELFGLGGDRMRSAGVDLFYPLAEHAVMGVNAVIRFVPKLLRLLKQLEVEFNKRRPDAVVLIDYPGFHWWLAAKAKSMGIPVVSFVPPQIWAWASHRVRKMRAYFDHVLCALPFEAKWFHERGVANVRYIGHPYFDELPQQKLDTSFLNEQRKQSGAIVAMLPGSRNQEVRHNMQTLLNVARYVHARRPDTRFLFPCFKDEHRHYVAEHIGSLPAEVLVNRTPEVIEAADACVAVSGSVGLELLYRQKPTVVVYRTGKVAYSVFRMLRKVKYISIVNLIAGREIYPEFLTTADQEAGPGDHILAWLNDSEKRSEIAAALADLKARHAAPGACQAAAQFLVQLVDDRRAAA